MIYKHWLNIKSVKVDIMNELQEDYSQHNVIAWASMWQNLSSGFGNNKGTNQSVQSDQCLCYLLNENLNITCWFGYEYDLVRNPEDRFSCVKAHIILAIVINN